MLVKYLNWKAALFLCLLMGQSIAGCFGNDNPSNYDSNSVSIEQACIDGLISESDEPWSSDNPFISSTSDVCNPKFPGGIVISLDDISHLNSWWEHREMFNEMDVKFTMFIDRTWKLTDEQWTIIETFQTDGHEIGLHGRDHISIMDFIDDGNTIESYIESQVINELTNFSEHGIYPTAFSYPHGERSLQTDSALLKHFSILRATNMASTNTALSYIVDPTNQIVVSSMSSDREYNSLDSILDSMEDAATKGQVVVTYGHRLDSNDNPYHTTDPNDLVEIIEAAKELNLEFMTISELARPPHQKGTEIMYDFLDEGNLSIAERMLENCWILPRFDEVCFEGDTPLWNEDPYDENYWRFIFYSLRPLRHLLYAWNETDDVRYKDKIDELLISFEDRHLMSPYLYDFEADKHGAAFRAMVLVNIRWKFEHSDMLSNSVDKVIDTLLIHTGTFLANPENFEGGYNHGFTQAAGLMLVAINMPWLEGTFEWDVVARERMLLLMTDAIGSDGVLKENSPVYHIYVMGFVENIVRWGNSNNITLPIIMQETLDKMVNYAVHISHPNGELPLLGASLPTYNLKSTSFNPLSEIYDELAFINSDGMIGKVPSKRAQLFEDSGQVVMRSEWKSGENFSQASHLVFDAGPYRTKHSDLDALTITWYSGREIIVDPGVYTYEHGIENSYFRSTPAHNLVVVDFHNQIEGSCSVPPTLVVGEGWSWSSAAHSLSGPLQHRGIGMFGDDILLVIDYVESDHILNYNQTWHLAHDLYVAENGQVLDLVELNSNLVIGSIETISDSAIGTHLVTGSEDPFQGWVSDGYEKKLPNTVIGFDTASSNWMIATLITANTNSTSFSGTIGNGAAEITITTEGKSWQISVEDLGTTYESLTII